MGLRDLDLKSAYKSSEDDVLMDFYVPCLAQAVQYDRLAGYFSSSAFSVVAEGLLSFIEGRGRMRLICSPELQLDDIEILTKSPEELDALASNRMIQAMEYANASDLERDHLMVLAYMLVQDLLEVKLAVPAGRLDDTSITGGVNGVGIFHEKIGVLTDSEGDMVSFSGSINESATAWLENAEDFKVFRSWIADQKPYQEPDRRHFDALWNNTADGVRVFSLPEAVKRNMLQRAPAELDISSLRAKYEVRRAHGVAEKPGPPLLFSNQLDAMKAWRDSGGHGILEMATGTGKTLAALGCLMKTSRICGGLTCAIAVPQSHLVEQWMRQLKLFFPDVEPIVVDSANPQWVSELSARCLDVRTKVRKLAIAVGTYSSLSSATAVNILVAASKSHSVMLIADEVHRAGALVFRRVLHDSISLRLGLSATPVRWFDETGTNLVSEYFGGVVYTFDLSRALTEVNPATGHTYLVSFEYFPHFCEMNGSERQRYLALTRQLVKAMHSGAPDEQTQQLIFARSRLVKNTASKQPLLCSMLDEIRERGLCHHLIVYCTERQMADASQALLERRISFSPFTMRQGTKPSRAFGGRSEREHILDAFAAGKIQALLAIKCLDEGVDVPPARTCIMMASGTSPIEHIQRLGRILRPYPGKTVANVFDLLVDPGTSGCDDSAMLSGIEKRERSRYEEIALLARNGGQALSLIYSRWGGTN